LLLERGCGFGIHVDNLWLRGDRWLIVVIVDLDHLVFV
jgi:hypothetical protein